MSKPGRGSDQFPLRLPDGMRVKIRDAAEANGRSMNAEIVHRLQTTLEMDSYNPSENAGPAHDEEWIIHIRRMEETLAEQNRFIRAALKAMNERGVDPPEEETP